MFQISNWILIRCTENPKIHTHHSYFFFMQDMRTQIPGWENKGNVELQSMCDPLWRKLLKEEKEKYKRMKKGLKMSDRLQASEEYQSCQLILLSRKYTVEGLYLYWQKKESKKFNLKQESGQKKFGPKQIRRLEGWRCCYCYVDLWSSLEERNNPRNVRK